MKTPWSYELMRERRELYGGAHKKTSVVKSLFEINSNELFATTCFLFLRVCACKYGAGGVHKIQKCVCAFV